MGKQVEVDDRFRRFGTVSFTGITKVNDFVGYLEQGKVMGTLCKVCGAFFFPPRADCAKCLSSEMEWQEIAGTGRLVSFSKLAFAPMGFTEDVPYAIALLDYGKFKIFGRIGKDIPDEEVRVGMEMRTVVNTLPSGQMNYVFVKP